MSDAPEQASDSVPDTKKTMLAREALAAAFKDLGGVKALVEWVGKDDANGKTFYGQLWPKLLALEADAAEDPGPRVAGALTWLPPT